MRLDYTIGHEDANMRLDDFFYKQGISRKLLKDARNHGQISVNNKQEYFKYLVQEHDNITIIFPKETSTVVPVNIPLNIVYEDDYLLIIDKQKGLPVIPNKMYYTYSLGNALMYYYQQHNIDSAIHIVNRLDKETTGYLLVAKSRYIHNYFSKDIKQIQRVYHALVEGKVNQGTITKGISHEKDHPTKRCIDEHGLEAITHYRCIEYKDNISLVECILETGRTHQIRVHMASIGHPLIGDTLYGGKEGDFYLDSVQISFIHPITQKYMMFKKAIK